MMVRAMVASEKSGSEPETRKKRKSGSDTMVREVVAHSVSLRATTHALGGSGSRGVADVIAIRRSALTQEQCYLCQTRTVSFHRECMSLAGRRSSSGSGPEPTRASAH